MINKGFNMKDQIKEYYKQEIEIINSLNFDEIEKSVKAIIEAYKNNATIYTFGNGGSAATASHIVCDFNKGISEDFDKKFNVICLNDNIPSMLAISNDISYYDVFLYQLKNRIKKDDLVLAISGSGNSKNVIKAVEYAKTVGCKIVGLTGYSGGKLYELSDYHMHVPVDDMQITEDIHMSFDHMMYRVIRNVLMNC